MTGAITSASSQRPYTPVERTPISDVDRPGFRTAPVTSERAEASMGAKLGFGAAFGAIGALAGAGLLALGASVLGGPVAGAALVGSVLGLAAGAAAGVGVVKRDAKDQARAAHGVTAMAVATERFGHLDQGDADGVLDLERETKFSYGAPAEGGDFGRGAGLMVVDRERLLRAADAAGTKDGSLELDEFASFIAETADTDGSGRITLDEERALDRRYKADEDFTERPAGTTPGDDFGIVPGSVKATDPPTNSG